MAKPFYTNVTVPENEVAGDQSVQASNQLSISNVNTDKDQLLGQMNLAGQVSQTVDALSRLPHSAVDFTPRPEAPPVVKSPFSLMGAPSAATGAFLGSLVDKPGDLGTALSTGGKALLQAPFQDVADQPSPSKVLQQRGVDLPGGAGLFADLALDPTNLVGGEPITGAGKAAVALAAATPGFIEGLTGLTSRIISDVLPQLGKKGATGERLLSLFKKAGVAADEMTPALQTWLNVNKTTPISREALEQAVRDKGLQLGETLRGDWPRPAGLSPSDTLDKRSTKFSQYALPGAENYRESLIRLKNSGFDPSTVQWRELTGPELAGYVNPKANFYDDTGSVRAWLANDPAHSIVVYNPTIPEKPYSNWHGGDGLDYATLEEAQKASIDTMPAFATPEQRLETLPDGSYKWVAQGEPDVFIKPINKATRLGAEEKHYTVTDAAGQKIQPNFADLDDAVAHGRYEQANKMTKVPLAYQQTSHWPESNVLVHARVADHDIEGGGKALLIDEVQSDWHTHETNGGRYYGYRKPSGEWIPPDYTVEHTKPTVDTGYTAADGTHVPVSISDDRDLVRVYPKAYNKHRRKTPIYGEGTSEQDALADLKVKFDKHIPPDAPFKGTKADELGFKRMLAHAAENNYDAVTWTTGEQQADRYNRLLRDITAIKLDDEGTLWAKTPGGWKSVEGTFEKPEDTAAVLGHDAAARLAASDKSPRWEFTITDPDGEAKVMSFTTRAEADKAYEAADKEHGGSIRKWDDLSSSQQDDVYDQWIENAADDFVDAGADEANEWLHDQIKSKLDDAENDIADATKDHIIELAKENNIDLDPETIEWERGRRSGFKLWKAQLRDKAGNELAEKDRDDIARWFESEGDNELDELEEKTREELQDSEDYYTVLDNARDEVVREHWRYSMNTREKFEQAKKYLDEKLFNDDGYTVGDVEKTGGAYHLDLSANPLTLGSKGMEQEYDVMFPTLAQGISNKYGDGTKVQKMRISADDASDRPFVAQIVSDEPNKQTRYGSDSWVVRTATPGASDGDYFTTHLPDEWIQRVGNVGPEQRGAKGKWVLVDHYGGIRPDGPFDTREAAEAAYAKIPREMQEVWGLRITPKLRSYILDKGLPLASILFPAVGTVVTMKDGTRVRIERHNDDGTLAARPVRGSQ